MNIPQQGGVWRLTQPVTWLAAASGGWLGLILASPVAPVPLALVVYAVGGAVCHQIASRSFHIGTAQLPVCARCTAIYAGAAVSFAWQAARLKHQAGTSDGAAVQNGVMSARLWLACGALPTLVTVALEQAGLWHTSNIERAIAGFPLGISVAFVAGRAATLHLLGNSSASGPVAPMSRP